MRELVFVDQSVVRLSVNISHSGSVRIDTGTSSGIRGSNNLLIPSFLRPSFLLKPPLPIWSSPLYPFHPSPSPPPPLITSSLARPFSSLLPVVCVCVGKIKLLWQSCVYKYAGRETGQATLNRNRIQIAFLSLLGPGREKMCLRLLLLRLWRIKLQYWVWAPC